MPELAEVEFNRKQWNCGLKQKILAVELHGEKRIFRGYKSDELKKTLTGSKLVESMAHGKQMLFHFSRDAWLGIHLGMTGELSAEKTSAFVGGKHDHLVLRQKKQTLVFNDPRQFGRVRFNIGKNPPDWWASQPVAILSKEFSISVMQQFLKRRGKAPIKAVLLMQNRFPGVGNWMADEILWQAQISPRRAAGKINAVESKRLYRSLQFVCRHALRIVGTNDGDLPKSWFFHRRWKRGGHCSRDGTALRHAQIGGRTTCWCPGCQK